MADEMLVLAKYPFLKEAARYLKEQNVSIEEIINDTAYERVRLVGRERVMNAVENADVGERPLSTYKDRFIELLSYPIARMLVSCISDAYLVRRYALAEAVRANERLRGERDPHFILRVGEELGMNVHFERPHFKLHFSDFLRHSVQMRSREWKLVRQNLDRGYVTLEKTKFVRLIQSALQMRFEHELPLPVTEDIEKGLRVHIQEIRSAIEKKKAAYTPESMGRVSVMRLPPCMKLFLTKIQHGEHLPHSARFAFASFLHTIGLSSEEVLKIFARAPDFNERLARYQVEHITGKISGTEYTPPSCSTMKTYGICPGGDELCKKEWMNHPLTYYRVKGKKKTTQP